MLRIVKSIVEIDCTYETSITSRSEGVKDDLTEVHLGRILQELSDPIGCIVWVLTI